MEDGAGQTPVIQTRCCPAGREQLLPEVLSEARGLQGSCDIPRAKLGVICTPASAALGEVFHWDCCRGKVSRRFVRLFSTPSCQEMRLL